MRKPMVKAMACALAFTMVATTPLSASASGIAGLYSTGESTTKTATETETTTKTKTLDGKEVEKIEHRDENGNLNSTGTTTITTTNTNGLDSYEGGQENDKYIIGVNFDKEVINLEAGEETGITAMVLFSDGTSMNADNFKDLLVFRKIQTKAEGQSLGAGSVTYANYDWTAGGMDILTRDTLKVRGIHGGSFYIEAALKTDKSGEYKYFDVVAVNVKEYAESITTIPELSGYAKHTYSLEDLGLTREAATSNDEIILTAYEVRNGVEKNTSYVKVNKDNTFTIKKDIGSSVSGSSLKAEVWVKAVSEKGKIAKTQITTKKATPITKIDKVAKVELGFNTWDKTTADVTLKTYIGKNVPDDEEKTTDVITWTTKNANVATVASTTGKSNTIIATGAGKTVITAKATSGKSVKINVTVTADLQAITAIVDEDGNNSSEVYPGQKVQLTAVKDPAQSNTKITWISSNKNIAKVDKNGVVTASSKNKDANLGEVKITAKFTRVNENGSKTKNVEAEKSYTLTVKKSELTADKLVLDDTYKIGKETPNKDGSLKADVIYVTKYDDYNAEATMKNGSAATDADGKTFDTNLLNNMLTWTSSKAKAASVDGTGYTKALSAGKTNVTASVVNAKGKTLKAKVSVASTQAVTSLQTNKTVVNVSPDKNGKIKDVTLKVSKQLPKKATKESLTWELVEGSGSISLKDNNSYFNSKKYVGKTASAKVQFSGAQVGDSATIKVTAANGATTTVVVNVVNATKKVKFAEKTIRPSVGDEVGNLYDMVTIVSDKDVKASDVKAGNETGYENVEFSVNKSGIVTIDAKGNVYAVKKGTVKITAKTPSGKKAVMTVKVQ